jgi:hypothetical protein
MIYKVLQVLPKIYSEVLIFNPLAGSFTVNHDFEHLMRFVKSITSKWLCQGRRSNSARAG